MKNNGLILFLSFFLLSFLIGCQQGHEQKLKNAVKEHLKKQVDESKNYKSKSFGTIDSIFKDLQDNNQYKMLTDTSKLAAQIDGLTLRYENEMADDMDSLKEEIEKKKENLRKRRKRISNFKENYEPPLAKYVVPHSYQLVDSKHKKIFHVDTAYNVVTSKPAGKE